MSDKLCNFQGVAHAQWLKIVLGGKFLEKKNSLEREGGRFRRGGVERESGRERKRERTSTYCACLKSA